MIDAVGCGMWQGMLPAEAQDHERIRAHLNSAINAMNSAVHGIPLQYSQPASAAAAGAGYGYAGTAGEISPHCSLRGGTHCGWPACYCLCCPSEAL